MDSSVGKVIFCSISRRERILYSYNGGDSSLDSLARLCLASAPPFHSHYFHSSAARTFSFLFHSDLTYFAIVSATATASAGSPPDPKPKILRLLRQIRDGFATSAGGGDSAGDDLVKVIRRLIDSTEESMGRIAAAEDHNGFSSTASSSSTKAPLLDRREEVSMEVESADSTDSRMRKRRFARETWWRHVKIVAAVDLLVCAALFGIWMAVCRGFKCVY